MRVGKTAVVHFVSQITVSIAGFVATFVIARALGAEGVGIYALGVALLMWIKIPAGGLTTGMAKRISEGVDEEAHLSVGILLNVVFGVGVAIGILLFSPQVNGYVGAPVGTMLALLFVSEIMMRTVGAALTGEKKVDQWGILNAIERIGRTVIQVALILLGYGVAGLFFGHALTLGLTAILGTFLIGIHPRRPSWTHVRSLLDFARYSWLGTLKRRSFSWMDTIVLGFFVTQSLIGIYEVAWTLATFFVLIANSIKQTLFPELSELGVEGDFDRIHHFVNEGLVFTGILLIPGLFGALAIGEDVLRIYSPEFTQGVTVLAILIVARLIDSYGSQLVSAINAIDRPDVAFRINAVFVGANLGLNVVLISAIGWVGAAIATLVSGSITLVLSYIAMTRLIGRPDFPIVEIGKQVLSALVMFVGVLTVEPFTPRGHEGTVLLAFGGAACYVAVLLATSVRVRHKCLSLAKSV